uniref:Steroid receptor RNA activator 1 n=1 Tax=Callorhinchus milii TaxID=7868 RepID=V9L3I4_CALMI|eukprot:gi/632967833/ref/XP_007900200.1/ PREDICTED: steroid receptor RNA activator 1 [Callorhinchus milii]
MSDLFVKPGNQERGWNDPPQFSYGLQTQAQTGQRKNILNKRVVPPQLGSQRAGIPSVMPITPPVACQNTPPPPPKSSDPSDISKPLQMPTVVSECEVNVEDVLTPLNKTLEACRTTVKKQICDDIGRRLKILQDMWQAGKLSETVRKRMHTLAQEMAQHNWDSADEMHRSLMVDHVNEVGQWMVGVKRLIAETKNLPPGLILPKEEGCESEEKLSV